MADLEMNFCGIRFKNPVVASSAEPTLNAGNMMKCIDTGAGGVIAKTMTDSEPMRELTTRSKWRFLNQRHEVCRGKVPRAFTLYGRSGLALDDVPLGIHGVDRALEARTQQILEDNAADRVFTIAGAKEDDAPGCEQGSEIMGVHGRSCGRFL